MANTKSKARKLAEFLRNINNNAKLETSAVATDNVVRTSEGLTDKSEDTEALVSAASVTSYVSDKLTSYVQEAIQGVSHDSTHNRLIITHENGTVEYISLGDYLDDTNNYVTNASFSTSTGELELTLEDNSTVTVDLDGRYIRDYTVTTQDVVAQASHLVITESQISDLQNYLTNAVTGLTHNTVSRELVVNYADNTSSTISLTQYIDDSNLARITNGALNATSGIATFVRDDNSTFTVDFSALFDDTNWARIISADFNSSNGVLTLTRNDNTTISADLDGRYTLKDFSNVTTLPTPIVNQLKGQKGEVGQKGQQGFQGIKGVTGSKGQKGEIGATGATGAQGSKGQKGELGAQGTKGNTGAQGLTGVTGSKGDTGAQGSKGQKGQTGSTGNTGATGSQGSKGQKGTQGQQGATGPTGAQGATGAQGSKGNTGATGGQGAQGSKGQKGEIGQKGTTGDKGSTGAQGAKGQKGELGQKGSTGSKGQKGEIGNTGATGSQGSKGQKGEIGSKGNTGAQGPASYDAGTLDGIDSSGFMPLSRSASRSSDSFGTYILAKDDGGFAGSKPPGSHNGVGMMTTHTHTGNYYTQLALDTSQNQLWLRSANNTSTFGGWTEIWASNNDGSGSGLDADLLDGQHGSYYAPASHSHSLTLSGDVSGSGSVSGTISVTVNNDSHSHSNYMPIRNSTAYTVPTTTTWGSFNLGNGTMMQAAGTGRPSGSTHGYWFVGGKRDTSGGYAGLYFNHYSGANGLFVGGHTEGSSAPNWERVWTSNTDGSGSGLDADLLDGKHASEFALAHSHPYLRSDIVDTLCDTSSSGTLMSRNGFSDFIGYNPSYGSYIGGGAGNASNYIYSGGYISKGGVHTLWHSGNDGSGSGLDADLLDGQHGSYYAPASHNHSLTLSGDVSGSGSVSGTISVSVNNDSHYHSQVYIPDTRGASRAPSYYPDRYASWDFQRYTDTGAGGDGWHVVNTIAKWTAYDSSHRQEQVAYTGTNVKHRTATSDSAWGGWATFWDSANDGSGSGLDADLLDGIQGGSFWRRDADNTGYALRFGREQLDFTANSKTSISPMSIKLWDNYGGASAPTTYGSVLDIYGRSGHSHHQFYMYQKDLRVRSSFYNQPAFSSWALIWNSDNDGSGSGLDADLLDGLQLHTGRNNEANKVVRTDGSGYIQAGWINTTSGDSGIANDLSRIYCSHDGYLRYLGKSEFKVLMGLSKDTYDRRDFTSDTKYHTGANAHGAVNMNDLFARGSGFIDVWSSPTGRPPSGSHFNGFQALHYSASNTYHHGMQMVMASGNPSSTYLRGWWANGGSGYAWQKIWTDGNDGSGSGLDADLLDGVHGSSFLRSDANDSYSGTLTHSSQVGLVPNDYGKGVFGKYSSTRYQHVWSMGTSYKTNTSGTSYGNMYGLTWTHTNIGTGTNQSISGLSHQLQLRMNGTLYCAFGSGIWTSGNITAYSDRAVKTNLEVIPNALDKVMQINGYTYDRTDYVEDPETGIMPDTRQAGVVAQEVEAILPEVVSGEEGNKAVAYGNMVALLIEAIKEQQTQITDLQSKIESLQEK